MKKFFLITILLITLAGCTNSGKTIYFEDAKKKELTTSESQKEVLNKFADNLNSRDLKLQFRGTSNIFFEGKSLLFGSDIFLDGQKVRNVLTNGKKKLYWVEENNKYFYISKDEKEWYKLPESTFTESLIDTKIFFPFLNNFKDDTSKEESFEYMSIVLENHIWTHKFKIKYTNRTGYYLLYINIDNLTPVKIDVNTPGNIATMFIYNENTSVDIPKNIKELDSVTSVGKVSEIVLDFLKKD